MKRGNIEDDDDGDCDDDDFLVLPVFRSSHATLQPSLSESPNVKRIRKSYEWEILQERSTEEVMHGYKKTFTFNSTLKKPKSGPYQGGKMFRYA